MAQTQTKRDKDATVESDGPETGDGFGGWGGERLDCWQKELFHPAVIESSFPVCIDLALNCSNYFTMVRAPEINYACLPTSLSWFSLLTDV